MRFADLNGDGCQDLIALGYSSSTNDTRPLLYFGDGAGQFHMDPVFASLNLRGKSESAVVADFNNDGFVDIYLPFYTCNYPATQYNNNKGSDCGGAPRAYLFLNDGHGHFREVAQQANLDFAPCPNGNPTNCLNTAPWGMQPEGVQVADVNNDGLLDIYVGGRMMINTGFDANGVPHFRDICALNSACGLPNLAVLNTNSAPQPGHPDILGNRADEGFKFLDWNNDGLLDLVLLDWRYGPILFQNIGTASNPAFAAQNTRTDGKGPFFSTGAPGYQAIEYQDSFQVQTYDLDNDGLEDLIAASSPANDTNTCRSPPDPNFLIGPCPQTNRVFRNVAAGFEAINPTNISNSLSAWDLAFADVDRDGRIDIVYQGPTWGLNYFHNTTANNNSFIAVEMLGPNGERNQFGRIVQAIPQVTPPVPTYTRVVDGGSGERSQNQYEVLIGTPYKTAPHLVKAYYPKVGGGTFVVSFQMTSGERAQVFAPSAQYPNGRVFLYTAPSLPPPPAHGVCAPWAPGTPSSTVLVRMYGSNGFSFVGNDGNVWWAWNNGSASTASGWKTSNLTAAAGANAPTAVSGSSLLGYTDPISGNGNTFYVGIDQHIHLLASTTTSEYTVDVTAASGGRNAVAGTPLVQMYNSNGFSYLGTDGNVWWAWNNGNAATASGWLTSNLTSLASAPLAATGSSLLAYTDPISSNGNTYYVGVDQHVHLLASTSTSESTVDITAATAASSVVAGSPLSRMYNSNGFAYIGTDNNIWWAWNNGNAATSTGWLASNLTGYVGAPAAAAASALLTYADPVSGNGNVYYVGVDQHIHLIATTATTAYTIDITSLTGGPNAVAGSPLVRMYNSNGFSYVGTDGNVWWGWNNGSAATASGWSTSNLTAAAGTGALSAVSGTTLLGYTDPVSRNGNTYYVGIDGHIHLLAWTGTSAATVDVTSSGGGPTVP